MAADISTLLHTNLNSSFPKGGLKTLFKGLSLFLLVWILCSRTCEIAAFKTRQWLRCTNAGDSSARSAFNGITLLNYYYKICCAWKEKSFTSFRASHMECICSYMNCSKHEFIFHETATFKLIDKIRSPNKNLSAFCKKIQAPVL